MGEGAGMGNAFRIAEQRSADDGAFNFLKSTAPAPDAHRSRGVRRASWSDHIAASRGGKIFHTTPNPITPFSLFFFPKCSSLAARAFSISRSSMDCVILHFAGSASSLPA